MKKLLLILPIFAFSILLIGCGDNPVEECILGENCLTGTLPDEEFDKIESEKIFIGCESQDNWVCTTDFKIEGGTGLVNVIAMWNGGPEITDEDLVKGMNLVFDRNGYGWHSILDLSEARNLNADQYDVLKDLENYAQIIYP